MNPSDPQSQVPNSNQNPNVANTPNPNISYPGPTNPTLEVYVTPTPQVITPQPTAYPTPQPQPLMPNIALKRSINQNLSANPPISSGQSISQNAYPPLPPQPEMYQNTFQTSNSPLKKKSMLPLIIIVIVLLLIVAGAAAYFLVFKSKTVTYTQTVTNTVNTSDEHASVTAAEIITANCGHKDCLAQKFATCSPVTATITIEYTSLKTYLTVKGLEGTGCSTTVEYNDPGSPWDNKSMTCQLNDKLTIDNALGAAEAPILIKSGNVADCTGPLVAAMQANP